jgi:hypothetical protein
MSTRRVNVTIVWSRPWWRRLLHLPAKGERRGPFRVVPWPDDEPQGVIVGGPETITRYRADERERYEPPGCDHCGARVDQGWVNVTLISDREPMYMPGKWVCRTPGCPRSDPPRRIYWAGHA